MNAVNISTEKKSGSATTTTSFSINPPTYSEPTGSYTCNVNNQSFDVKVSKTPNVEYSGAVNVLIEARGYNTCDKTNPKRVERGLYTRLID
jgi:hypothetical protein